MTCHGFGAAILDGESDRQVVLPSLVRMKYDSAMGVYSHLRPGTPIGPYLVEAEVGHGGFGTVYRARATDGSSVALKISHQSTASLTAQQLVWLQNEIEALVRLNHPSLVHLYSYGFLPDDHFYIAMEFVEGVPLDRYLQEHGRVELAESIALMRRISEAVAHCHEQGILHLDLKPSNILLIDPHSLTLKVLDFGLATLNNQHLGSESATVAGTLGYMPPECLKRRSRVASPKTDIYALGVIWYQLITDQMPSKPSSLTEALISDHTPQITPIEDLAPSTPSSVRALIQTLMAEDPNQRHGNVTMLGVQLKELYYSILGRPLADQATVASVQPVISSLQVDSTPLLGRDEELRQLQQDADAAHHGQQRSVLITGEAGIGKSHLCVELVSQLSIESNVVVAHGRCRQFGSLVPYSCLREVLANLSRALLVPLSESPDLLGKVSQVLAKQSADLLRLVPEMAQLVRDSADAVQPDLLSQSKTGADRVTYAVSEFLKVLSGDVTVVLLLEDLHWADEGTHKVISSLLSGQQLSRLLVIGTARPSSNKIDWEGMRQVALRPLSSVANRSLLSTLLGNPPSSLLDRLLGAVPMLAEGSPLFTSQVIRSMEHEGVLSRDDAGRALIDEPRLAAYSPPSSVADVLSRRLLGLDARTREVVAVATLLGRSFRHSDLTQLGLFSAQEVAAAISEAEQQSLCVNVNDVCTFVHDTIREQAERLIESARLPEIHRSIARNLRGRGLSHADLATHLERGEEMAEAAVAYFEAGLDAVRLSAPFVAGRHMRRAFEILEGLPADPGRDDLLVRATSELSRINALFGRTDDTMAMLLRCSTLVPQTTLVQRAALDSAYARVYYAQGKFADAIRHASSCLAAGNDPALRAIQCTPANMLGRALCASGKFGPSIPVLKNGCDLLREAREYSELTHSQGLLGSSYAFCGDFAQARYHIGESARIAAELRDSVRRLGALFYYSMLAEAAWDFQLGVECTTELLVRAEEDRVSGLYLYIGTLMAGRHQFHVGKLHRARVLLSNALNLSHHLGIAIGRAWASAYLGDIYFLSQNLSEATRYYEEGIGQGRAGAGDELGLPMNLVGAAHCRTLLANDLTGAQALAEEACSRLRAVGNRAILYQVLLRYAELLSRADDAALYQKTLDEALALKQELGLSSLLLWPKVEPSERQLQGPTSVSLSSSAKHEPIDASSDTLAGGVPAASRPLAVVEQLSTVDGFVPVFALGVKR